MKKVVLCLAAISALTWGIGSYYAKLSEHPKTYLAPKQNIEANLENTIYSDASNKKLDAVDESVSEVKALEEGLYMEAEDKLQDKTKKRMDVSQNPMTKGIVTLDDTLDIPKLSHNCDHTLKSTSLVKFLDTSSPKYKEFEKRTAMLQVKYDRLRERFLPYQKEVLSSIKTATPLKNEAVRLQELLKTRPSYKQNKKLWDEYNIVLNKLIPYMKTMNIAQKKLVLLKMDALSMRTELHMFQAEMGDLRFLTPCSVEDKDIPTILKECDTTINGYRVELNNYIEGLKKIPENDGSLESNFDSAKQSIDYIKSTGNNAVIMSRYIDFIEETKYRIKSNLFLKSTRRN